ncbi:MAG: type III-B CRISPR-associated protein Cas10/Cmr2 [Cyanobacteria bacterium P01_G01_bin.54]
MLFTFSPVQEFIKASRKFADFWSGSYILHYLSAQLCWYIAEQYGPDAVITPSLWDQEIIDALLIQKYSIFAQAFDDRECNPVERFKTFKSRSLSTAGFPNAITAVVSGREDAIALGKALQTELKTIWCEIAEQVRGHIKGRVIDHLSDKGFETTWKNIKDLFPGDEKTYKKELQQLQQHGCWEWNKLWEAQISNTWQPYFVAVPLGNPEGELVYRESDNQTWIRQQNAIAQPRTPIPTEAEQQTYAQVDQDKRQLNVGSWWGSLQARLGQSMQAVKNTRRWQIPTAPGERSSLSGQFSALHPRLHYTGNFKHGRGMAAGSMRLFWKLMSLAYPGLFDGSEKLNALELTKRMAWVYGGVAEELGIEVYQIQKQITSRRQQAGQHSQQDQKFQIEQRIRLLYERFSRFPNLTSIAAARFIHDHTSQTQQYWKILEQSIRESLPKQRRTYKLLTRIRPTNIPKTDTKINPERYARKNLNGVMFSSKWLAQDMGLDKEDAALLRGLVSKTHQDMGFGDDSPADWWALVLADGDGMGKYVSGHKLKTYDGYLLQDLIDLKGIKKEVWSEFLKTKKRMGPATHVGLNRALLDFSNRLVPHLTEHRYCGKVIYSGGDDVLVALPLADLPGFLRSLRAAWCGGEDPEHQFDRRDGCGYWHPPDPLPENLPERPLFTMGEGATMSMGIVVAHKSVPLPTVLENLWDAEKERAKKLLGGKPSNSEEAIKAKDGLCFRIIYGSGNTREALMKGHLLDAWWEFVQHYDCAQFDLSPVLNRLAEELPKHVEVTPNYQLCCQAARAILMRREDQLPEVVHASILSWLSQWEAWAWAAQQTAKRQDVEEALGTELEDLASLLRFTSFWISRRRQELSWVNDLKDKEFPETELEVSCV